MIPFGISLQKIGFMRIDFSNPKCHGGGRAIFLDRDGVINERIVGGYVCDWQTFRFLPGALRAVQLLTELDLPIIVVSNQAGVAKGMMSRETLKKMTCSFQRAIADEGGRIDSVYYCLHRPADDCDCRKPRPGLLQRAATDWALHLENCIMVGDSPTDMAAGAAVQCRNILIGSGDEGIGSRSELKYEMVQDLLAAAELLRASMESPVGALPS